MSAMLHSEGSDDDDGGMNGGLLEGDSASFAELTDLSDFEVGMIYGFLY